MSTLVILQQMFVIVIMVAIGIYLEKKDVVDALTSRKLSAIVVDVCNPAMIMASILSGGITAERRDLMIAIGLGVAFYALLVILGFVLPKILRVEKGKQHFYNLMTVYTNTGFIGIPVARAILPPNAILYVIVINVLYSFLFYTHGITILSGGQEKINLKKAINPGMIMAVLSLVVFWFKIVPPLVVTNTISYIGDATVFLSMTLLGVSIARSNVFGAMKDLRIWLFILIRMIAVPVAIVLIMRACGFDNDKTLGLCLMAAVPVGNMPMIQAERLGQDTKVLSTAIAVTTVASIVTITILISIFSQ